MLDLPPSNTAVRGLSRCKEVFKKLVELLDSTSVPTVTRGTYEKWIQGTA